MSQIGPEQEQITWPEAGTSLEKSSDTCTEAVRIEIDLIQDGERCCLHLTGAFATDTVEYSRKNRWGGEDDHCLIEYGIGGGELHLRLRNAVAPLRNRYGSPMPQSYAASTTTSREHEREQVVRASIGFGLSSSFGLEGEARENIKSGRESGAEYSRPTITAKGSEDYPVWIFDAGDSARHLSGAAPGYDPPLATLVVSDATIAAFAAFMVRRSGLHLAKIHPKRFGDSLHIKRLAVVGQALPGILYERSQPRKKQESEEEAVWLENRDESQLMLASATDLLVTQPQPTLIVRA